MFKFLRILIPNSISVYIRLVKNRLKYKNSYIDTPYIMPQVKIGNSCKVNRNVVIMSTSSLEDYSYVNFGTKIGLARIGRFCSIGNDCEIGMHAHPISHISTSPKTYGVGNIFNACSMYNELSEEVEIGHDVWIGSKSIIMPGIKVGNGAIIGAGSVVTKNVQPYEIVVGVPAKHLRFRFDKEIIDYLEKLKWWNLDENQMNKVKKFIHLGEEWTKEVDLRELK
ncbi:CatB-related O-acetyltransferase [Bacillus pacificus]